MDQVMESGDSPCADGRGRVADGVRVGAGDAFVELVSVHLHNEPRIHGRDERVETVSVEERYGLPTAQKNTLIFTCSEARRYMDHNYSCFIWSNEST